MDCQKCGACCTDQLVVIGARDNVPLLMRDHTGCFMSQIGGRCVALHGRVGISVTCSIYKQRPEECRVMKPGIEECLTIRAYRGL